MSAPQTENFWSIFLMKIGIHLIDMYTKGSQVKKGNKIFFDNFISAPPTRKIAELFGLNCAVGPFLSSLLR